MRKSIEIKNAGTETVSDIFRKRFNIVTANDGLSQRDVAKKVGMTPQAFWTSLAAKRMSLTFAVKTAIALDMSLDWLCELDGNTNGSN